MGMELQSPSDDDEERAIHLSIVCTSPPLALVLVRSGAEDGKSVAIVMVIERSPFI